MNIKAERIEQILQAVNRNLNLTISGQNEGNEHLYYNIYRTCN